jgi:hypothetical protein
MDAGDFGRAVDALLAKWKRADEVREEEIAVLRTQVEALVERIYLDAGRRKSAISGRSTCARHKRRGASSSPP